MNTCDLTEYAKKLEYNIKICKYKTQSLVSKTAFRYSCKKKTVSALLFGLIGFVI